MTDERSSGLNLRKMISELQTRIEPATSWATITQMASLVASSTYVLPKQQLRYVNDIKFLISLTSTLDFKSLQKNIFIFE